MSNKVRVYVATVVVSASLGLAALVAAGDDNALRSAQAAACFACLGVFAQFLSYRVEAKKAITVVAIPFLATIYLAPTWVSLVAFGGVAVVGAVINRRPTVKNVFNVAKGLLTGALAIAVYRVLGGTPWLVRFDFNWLAYVAAYVTYLLVNSLLVTTVVRLHEGDEAGGPWLRWPGISLVNDILALPMAYLFAIVYVKFGVLGTMALGLPLLAVRQLYKTNSQLARVNQELLELMVAAIEARDPYTSGHSRRVARNARIIGRAVGLPSRDVDRVAIAGLLHDVGKIHEVFAPLLRKPGKLSSEERTTMETHPIKSAELVKNVSHLNDLVSVIRNHHENWDGTGYPDGLRGEEIPLLSRIIMIADTVDAMTTDRPYRAAMGEADVRAELIRLSGKQFDPMLCEKLLTSTFYPALFERQAANTPSEIHIVRRRSLGLRAAAGA